MENSSSRLNIGKEMANVAIRLISSEENISFTDLITKAIYEKEWSRLSNNFNLLVENGYSPEYKNELNMEEFVDLVTGTEDTFIDIINKEKRPAVSSLLFDNQKIINRIYMLAFN